MPRPSGVFFALAGALAFLACMLPLHASRSQAAMEGMAQERRALVREYGLTDLCLFTEARYTRNPSLADLHTAFQDHPGSLEHFPSGALLGPPPHLAGGAP